MWYAHQGDTFQQKKNTSNVHNIDEYQRHYTEQKKSETREYIDYNFMDMTF